ncbi:MAG: hypothetical protein ACD_77C00388G0003 [uncultured bacterium]|nr:MAG: hypothetical protein ACD_77C00388G0003 [uncultured bacterium]HBY02499.1 N-acetylmuramoyl-L-alanine amidase [Rikenellaceae bacterium]
MPYRILLIFFCLLSFIPTVAQNNSYVSIRKVVIDAGHGGKDPGAVSLNRKTQEKNITLSVALKLGNQIKKRFPEIEVIYTRDTDVFIPLNQRTDIANRNKADLFISIHVNAAKARSASGTETFVMGLDKSSSNLEVSKLENSVIVLEGDDFSSKYEGFDPNVPESYIIFSLLQNSHLEHSLTFASMVQNRISKGPIIINRGIKQAGLLVLWRTTMPAVLVELGFISNTFDYNILVRNENHDKFANAIFDAFLEYKTVYEQGKNTSFTANYPASKDAEEIKPVVEEKITGPEPAPLNQFYAIQILAVTRILPKGSPDLKGQKDAQYVRIGKFYKYYIGKYPTQDDAAKELTKIRKSFSLAFIIKIENGIIVPMNN